MLYSKTLYILLPLILIYGHVAVFAQHAISITGIVIDSMGTPLGRASVTVKQGRDSLLTITAQDGSYNFPGISTAEFKIRVTMKGFTTLEKTYIAPTGIKSLNLPPLVLMPGYTELEQAVVVAQKAVQQKGDTISYNAGSYAMRDGARLEELIKKLPGINLTLDSGLLSMGKKVEKLLLDGKPFYGDDIAAALQNLPYDIIDKVEIIDDFGDNKSISGSKTGEPVKVLNIQLLPDKKHGLVGNALVGGGTEGTYANSLTSTILRGEEQATISGAANSNNTVGPDYIQLLNASYGGSWAPGWTNSGFMAISNDRHESSTNLIQDNYYTNGATLMNQSTHSNAVEKKLHIGFEDLKVKGASERLHITALIFNDLSNHKDVLSTAATENSSSTKTATSLANNILTDHSVYNFVSIFYEKPIGTKGMRIEATGDAGFSSANTSMDYQDSSIVTIDSGSKNIQLTHFKKSLRASTWSLTPGIYLYLPIGQHGAFKIGYNLAAKIIRNDQLWEQADVGTSYWTKVDSLTNAYRYETRQHNFLAQYEYHRDKLSFDAEAVASSSIMDNRSDREKVPWKITHFNLLPSISLTYDASLHTKIRLREESTIDFPKILEVQPITDLSNPQYPVSGNPQLKPAITRSLLISYEHNAIHGSRYSGLTLTLGYTEVENQVSVNLTHPADTSIVIQHTYYTNLTGNHAFFLKWRFEPSNLWAHHLKLSIWGKGAFSKTLSMADYSLFVAKSIGIEQHIEAQFQNWKNNDISIKTDYSVRLAQDKASASLFNSSYAKWMIVSNHYLLNYWKLSYTIFQSFTAQSATALKANRVFLRVGLTRFVLPHNQLSIGLSADNLLGPGSNIDQSSTTTSLTERTFNFSGASYLLKAQWNFEKIRNHIMTK